MENIAKQVIDAHEEKLINKVIELDDKVQSRKNIITSFLRTLWLFFERDVDHLSIVSRLQDEFGIKEISDIIHRYFKKDRAKVIDDLEIEGTDQSEFSKILDGKYQLKKLY